MWTDAILAYLHFMAIFGLFATLAREAALLRSGADRLDIEALARADRGFGITAAFVLLTGALRAAFGVKGWAFYAHNPAFHAKIGLFVLVGLISIAPTVAFLRWRKARLADAAFRVPEQEWTRMRRIVGLELGLLALIPLAAVIMARGLMHS
jgi:putative membrane protein